MKGHNPCYANVNPLGYQNMRDLDQLVPGIFSDDECGSMPLLCQELGLPEDAISVFKPGLDYKSFRLRDNDMDASESLYEESEEECEVRIWDDRPSDPIPGVHTPCTNTSDCMCEECEEPFEGFTYSLTDDEQTLVSESVQSALTLQKFFANQRRTAQKKLIAPAKTAEAEVDELVRVVELPPRKTLVSSTYRPSRNARKPYIGSRVLKTVPSDYGERMVIRVTAVVIDGCYIRVA